MAWRLTYIYIHTLVIGTTYVNQSPQTTYLAQTNAGINRLAHKVDKVSLIHTDIICDKYSFKLSGHHIYASLHHPNVTVVMLTKCSSLATTKVVKMTTSGTAIEEPCMQYHASPCRFGNAFCNDCMANAIFFIVDETLQYPNLRPIVGCTLSGDIFGNE